MERMNKECLENIGKKLDGGTGNSYPLELIEREKKLVEHGLGFHGYNWKVIV